jgi:hypothetical protein
MPHDRQQLGTGKCLVCNGTGRPSAHPGSGAEKKCSNCRGRGICPMCHGFGEAYSSVCSYCTAGSPSDPMTHPLTDPLAVWHDANVP